MESICSVERQYIHNSSMEPLAIKDSLCFLLLFFIGNERNKSNLWVCIETKKKTSIYVNLPPFQYNNKSYTIHCFVMENISNVGSRDSNEYCFCLIWIRICTGLDTRKKSRKNQERSRIKEKMMVARGLSFRLVFPFWFCSYILHSIHSFHCSLLLQKMVISMIFQNEFQWWLINII